MHFQTVQTQIRGLALEIFDLGLDCLKIYAIVNSLQWAVRLKG